MVCKTQISLDGLSRQAYSVKNRNFPMTRFTRTITSLALICTLVSCTTVNETGRSAINLMPESQLVAMSLQAFDDMKRTEPISKNKEHLAIVNRIGKRISLAIADDYPDFDWEFVVFDNDEVNAFAMAGGKVGVYTGLIELVDSDAELATVIGHEIAHVTARHSNERMSQQLIAAGLGALLYAGTDDMEDDTQAMLMTAYGIGSTVGAILPYSRVHENEADEIGIYYMALAGYNPKAALTFWEKMRAQGGASLPELLSTHPADDTRIKNMTALISKYMPVYEANRTR